MERAEETLAAVASAGHQQGISAHIFILDQGSCSSTVARLAAASPGRHPVTLLAAERNLGVAGGRNLISGLGHGRVIIALDNDAEFTGPHTAALMVAALDADHRLAAIGCRVVTHAGGQDDLSSWGYPLALLPRAGACFDTVTYVGAGHAIRRDAWVQTGSYDPRLFFCWEEFDFCLRAIALGWRIRYRGDIEIRHKVSPGRRVGWSGERWFYFVRNRIYIGRKLDPSWLRLAPRIAGYLLKGLRNGMLIQTLRALFAASAMAPRATQAMSPDGLSYLNSNDRAYRGSWIRRLRQEVFSRIGPPRTAAGAAKR